MNRRNFVKSGILSGVGALATGAVTASTFNTAKNAGNEKTFNLDYAFHEGMFRNLAGDSFITQIEYAYQQGFRSIEDNGLTSRPVEMQEKIGQTLAKLNMRMGVFVLPKGGNGANTLAAGKKDFIDIFIKGCHTSVEAAKRVNAKWITVVPGDYDRSLPMGVQTANVVDALRKGAEIFEPHGLIMVLEPLSDSPNLFLQYAHQTYEICRAVNSPSCKILYDAYHLQKNEGNLIKNIDYCWSEIAYIQVGDNPGRKEPTTGEINYKNVFKHLYKKGYKGIVGMEHGLSQPGKEGETALVNAYRDVDNFL